MRRITLFAKTPGLLKKKPTVYLKSPGGDLTVCGTECKRVGELKSRNGLTFDADACDVEVFIVFSENGESFSYSIPDSDLDTKMLVHGSSASTLAFTPYIERVGRFSMLDKNKRGLILAISIILLNAFIFGSSAIFRSIRSVSKIPKSFETSEISITLSRAFTQGFDSKFHVLYYTKTCTVSIIREGFDKYPDLSKLNYQQYCMDIMSLNEDDIIDVVGVGESTCLILETWDEDFNENIKIHAYLFEDDDAFWILQCVCPVDNYDYWSECFDEWANSLKFK